MSKKDLKNLGDLGSVIPGMLRSGRSRETSQLNSTPRLLDPDDSRPVPELSQIRAPPPILEPDTGEDRFEESGYGVGYGTSLVREQRKSVDYFKDKHNVESELEQIRDRIARYGLDLINEENWPSLIVSRFNTLNDEIQMIKANLVMAAQREYMSPVEQLIKELLDYRDQLELRAIDEENNGTFSRNSLPKKSSFGVHIDRTECPENVFSDTPEIAQTQPRYAHSEQIPELQSTSHLDTIEPDVLTCELEADHTDGLNDTLSTPMTHGAIEFLRDLEEDDTDLHGSVKRLKKTVKDLLTVSNKNVNITNDKYDEMTRFKRQSEQKAKDFELKLKEMSEKANKTDDRLDSALGELDSVRKSVKKVEQALHSVEGSLKRVDIKAGEMNATMVDMVESCNVALKEYEDQFQVQDGHISQISADAKRALTESTTNKSMIEGIRTIVTNQKEVLRKLTASNAPNLSLPIITNTRAGVSTPGARAPSVNRSTLDQVNTVRISTAVPGINEKVTSPPVAANSFEIHRMGGNFSALSQDRTPELGDNAVHTQESDRVNITPMRTGDPVVNSGTSRNDNLSFSQTLPHRTAPVTGTNPPIGQGRSSSRSVINGQPLNGRHMTSDYQQDGSMDGLDAMDGCDAIGLRNSDSNPGFQPVQVRSEVRDQSRPYHHQDNDSDSILYNSARVSRNRGSLSASPPRSRKRDNSMKREVAENKLRRKITELKKIISDNPLNSKTSEAEIKDAVVRQVPILNKLIESCDTAMDKYSEFLSIDEDLLDLVTSAIEEAGIWKDQSESLYKSAEIYDSNSGSRLDIVVKPFSGTGDQTVYAFLRDFENSFRGQGNDAKKVSKLYNHYLSNKVKFQASKMSKNYSDLKEWLVDRYGNPVTIVDTLLHKMESTPKPTSSNLAKKAEYFMMLDFVLKEIDEVSNETAIDKNAYQQHLYSQPIMKRIIDFIPYEEKLDFFKLLRNQGCDSKLVRGEPAFLLLRRFIDEEADAHDSNTPDVMQKEPPKAKAKAATVAHVGQEADDDDPSDQQQDQRPAVLAAQTDRPRSTRPPATKPAGWYNTALKFPCPIDNHDHETAVCTEFFSSTPKQRRDIGSKKICFVCMGPLDKCRRKKNDNKIVRLCSNVKKAGPLSCKACANYCQSSGISSPPFCVIMCQDPSHPKPTTEEVGRLLKDYWPSFNPSSVTPSMVLYAGSIHNTVSNYPPCIKSSRPRDDPFEVIFDTQTGNSTRVGSPTQEGQKKDFPNPSIHANPSIYVMQWLQIGGSKCLCFFDSGANIHMISGELAEREKIKVISQSPTVLKVVGGGEVITDYGTYQLNMSTTDESDYQSFLCHGLTEVAGPFDKHSLEEVNKEFRATKEFTALASHKLPEYVGGSKVQLLLGIHAQVLPVHLFTLPSGISVFKSPFTDIFGSNICYGGTHESFKKTSTPTGASHAVHFMSVLSQVQSCMQGLTQSVMDVFDSELLPGMDYFDPVHHSEKPSPLEEHLEPFETPLRAHGYVVSDDVGDGYNLLDLSSGTFSHSSSVHKAMIPIAKLRNMVAPDDGGTLVSYRCPSCAKCVKCKESPRTRAITLTETVEQDIIERSVFIDYLKRAVFVDLPFLQDPVTFLTQRHKGPNNYFSALTVYVQQCKKPVMLKDKMKEAHADLVSKGFMTKMDEMGTEVKQKISDAPFHHYYPWRIVAKEDSVSTPIRMIVDPTMTGLNLILAKGENRLGNLAEILIRNRVKRFAWSSDISKMYNQLKLNESAYPYSLFLFNHSLQSDIPPEVWVMLVAWYGVTPTGNQAGFAIDEMVRQAGPEYKVAMGPLSQDRYVDDVATGAATEEERERQIDACRDLLGSGGFSLKFVARSGVPPCSKASADGSSMKMLGYGWIPEQDFFSPGFSELNFHKKIRGAKKPNDQPIVTVDDAQQLMRDIKLTRKMCASKVAELFDPIGIWEPLKLQLKLHLSKLNHLAWDQQLSPKDQEHWKEILTQVVDFPVLTIPRCVVPQDAVDPNTARLVCISDAAAHAGGVAIYIGFELQDGSFSNQLLTAKSKLLSATIPRNELIAILLMTEVTFIVNKALNGLVKDILYVTDSTIAMSWCHNVNRKLKPYVRSRVESVRRMIEWTDVPIEELPLVHIDGTMNISDLLTKHHDLSVSDMSQDSEWQCGSKWMRLPFQDMPVKKYSSLVVDPQKSKEIDSECFQEPFQQKETPPHLDQYPHEVVLDAYHVLVHDNAGGPCTPASDPLLRDKAQCFQTSGPPKGENFFVDLITLGWQRARNTISTVIWAFRTWKHRASQNVHKECGSGCWHCTNSDLSQAAKKSDLMNEAEKIIFKFESEKVLQSFPKGKQRAFVLKEGIVYYNGRLDGQNQFTTKDLDTQVFFDAFEFSGLIPVVRATSDVFFSYVMYVHMKLRPHAGTEITLKEISKKMYVPDGPRKIIKAVRNTCVKCRIISKKTLQIEMANHHKSRTTISPPFYNVQMDIVYGFRAQPYKKARKSFKIYALVIVCLLTSATSILALEGMETQDVVSAIERHSARYGVPGEIFVDNGSQLKALSETRFAIRSLDAYLFDALGLKITVSTPKAHEQQGRVENKVKQIRLMLKRMDGEVDCTLSVLQWETIFAKVANMLDDIPMSKGNRSNVSDLGFDVITPNRLKLGRNNSRSLEGSIVITNNALPTDVLQRNRKITTTFFQILVDRIHHFLSRPPKWCETSGEKPKLGDTVLFLFKEGNMSTGSSVWKIGKVDKVDGHKLTIVYPVKASLRDPPTWSTVVRGWREVALLFSEDDIYLNSRHFFQALKKADSDNCE